MDPASWVSLGSSVLGAFKGSAKISGAGAGGFAYSGVSELKGGGWDVGAGAVSTASAARWFVLGAVVLVGLVIIKKGSK